MPRDLIPLPDQADDPQATLVAMDRLARLYPDTFRMLLLAAKEAQRLKGIEARLDGHSPAPASYAGIPELAADGSCCRAGCAFPGPAGQCRHDHQIASASPEGPARSRP